MKVYKIPCSWQMYGYLNIEAEDWDEAISIAYEEALPCGEYVTDSFEVDHEMIEFEREEERKEIRRKVDKGLPTEKCK